MHAEQRRVADEGLHYLVIFPDDYDADADYPLVVDAARFRRQHAGSGRPRSVHQPQGLRVRLPQRAHSLRTGPRHDWLRLASAPRTGHRGAFRPGRVAPGRLLFGGAEGVSGPGKPRRIAGLLAGRRHDVPHGPGAAGQVRGPGRPQRLPAGSGDPAAAPARPSRAAGIRRPRAPRPDGLYGQRAPHPASSSTRRTTTCPTTSTTWATKSRWKSCATWSPGWRHFCRPW